MCWSTLFSSAEISHKRGRNLGLDLRSVNTVILFAYGSLVPVVEEEEALKAYEDKSGETNTQKYLRRTDQVSEKNLIQRLDLSACL